ncbi:hypothetical protein HPP92_004482 [Vanilla planifolia]|uniref:TauD/TfdA-like domain-containing protein n=1 Tax=Vanilla planifolia TaxID=51239 RepID=A0A835RWU9_VANPL|nr:hypothetical protein HPP92_004482 [Vanilla planifolia]
MGFIESRVDDEKLSGGVAFPKTLLPEAGSEGDLAKLVRAERETLVAALGHHSALLFRGFQVDSIDDFEQVVEAFGWKAYPVQQGITTRTKLSDRIYSSNDADPEHLISFHHEMSLVMNTRPSQDQLFLYIVLLATRFVLSLFASSPKNVMLVHVQRPSSPSKIFFYCSEPSPEGGETSVVASDVVVEMMEQRMPEFVAKANELGLVFIVKTAHDTEADSGVVVNKSWKSSLRTNDEAEAVKRAPERIGCNLIRFLEDGRAELTTGLMKPIGVFGEKRAWLVPLLGLTEIKEDISNLFGDGSAVPEEVLRIYTEILEENCVDIKWQKGDVLLLDNLVVQHARRPGKPPRRILASMCK